MAYEKVFKAKDFCASLIAGVWSMKATEYQSVKPLNCLYYWGNQKWSADCNNLYKCWIWSKGELPKNVGGYWYNPGRYGLGDVTCKQLIDACADVSTNFTNIEPGEILYIKGSTDLDGHIGIYVGDYSKVLNGVTYTWNVVESTPIWNNGIQTTYLDKNGNRFQCKGGAQAGRWEKHGKHPNIEFPSAPTPVTDDLKYSISEKNGKQILTVDGKGKFEISTTTIVKKL